MMYDLKNSLQREQFLLRATQLSEKAASVVELTERQHRTLSQNNYLHLSIQYFAIQIGETMDYCKRRYFKTLCNADIFVRTKIDKVTKTETKYLRSTAELSKEECSTAIDRFIVWAANEAGIYIPEADNSELVEDMKVEVERNKRYL